MRVKCPLHITFNEREALRQHDLFTKQVQGLKEEINNLTRQVSENDDKTAKYWELEVQADRYQLKIEELEATLAKKEKSLNAKITHYQKYHRRTKEAEKKLEERTKAFQDIVKKAKKFA